MKEQTCGNISSQYVSIPKLGQCVNLCSRPDTTLGVMWHFSHSFIHSSLNSSAFSLYFSIFSPSSLRQFCAGFLCVFRCFRAPLSGTFSSTVSSTFSSNFSSTFSSTFSSRLSSSVFIVKKICATHSFSTAHSVALVFSIQEPTKCRFEKEFIQNLKLCR